MCDLILPETDLSQREAVEGLVRFRGARGGINPGWIFVVIGYVPEIDADPVLVSGSYHAPSEKIHRGFHGIKVAYVVLNSNPIV